MADISADEARRLREAATPGPWEVAEHDAEEFWFGAGYYAIEAGDPDEYGDHAAVVVTGRGDGAMADVALIAAAPDLAAEVERLTADNERLRKAASLAVTNLQAEHEPQWASDEMKARGKDPLGCAMCWPKDGGWPCNSRTEADDLAAALSDEGEK